MSRSVQGFRKVSKTFQDADRRASFFFFHLFEIELARVPVFVPSFKTGYGLWDCGVIGKRSKSFRPARVFVFLSIECTADSTHLVLSFEEKHPPN